MKYTSKSLGKFFIEYLSLYGSFRLSICLYSTGEYCRIQNQKDEGDSGYKSLLDTRVLDVKDPLLGL